MDVIVTFILFCALVCVNGYIPPEQLELMGVGSGCAPGEFYSECGLAGEATCTNPDPDTCYGPPSCTCRRDLVRDGRTGQCIKQEQCYVGPHPYPYPDYIPPYIPPPPDDD